ncbi:MAG: hypothetical protein WCI61_00370 [Chloroflexota bacterium]
MPVHNKALRIGAITAAVLGTVAIPATAFAATSSGHSALATVAGIHAQQQGGDSENFDGPADRGPRGGGAHFEALAKALNTTPDALKAAIKAAHEETKPATKPTTDAEREAQRAKYEAALAAKLNVTVDALKAALEANKPAHGPGGPGGKGERRGPGAEGPGIAKLATALNTTPDKLEAAMKAAHEETKPATKPTTDAEREAQRAKFEAALAAKLNVTVDQLKAALEANKPAKPTAAEMKAMIQPRLTQMVSKGTITQAQADQILADIDAGKPVFEVLKQFMPQLGGDHKGPGGPGGDHKGPGGPGGEHGRGPGGAGAPGQRGQQGPRA